MQKAVILVSGGLDSLTCLAYAKAEGFQCYALSFDYGQRHVVELHAAREMAKRYEVIDHHILKLPIISFAGSALTDKTLAVPKTPQPDIIPITYVPARNTVFLSYALGFAEVIDADYIITGVSAVDYSNYPDCRPEYIQAIQAMADLATKRGVEGRPIKLLTPLIHLSKADTILLGLKLGVDYSISVSCYQADANGQACRECDPCHFRAKGFVDAKVADPTRYQTCSH